MDSTIQALIDKDGVVLLIPYARDEEGIGRNINRPIVLGDYSDLSVLGKNILECFAVSRERRYRREELSEKVYTLVTGIQSFSKFSKDRKCVFVLLNPSKGYTYKPMRRGSDGSYLSLDNEKYIEIGVDASEEAIGKALIDAFEKCEQK